MSMTYQDYFIPDVMSNCCSAPIIITDMCSECYEHCEPEEDRPLWWDDFVEVALETEEDDDEVSSLQ